MANVQRQFQEFHEAIRLRRFEHNAVLREKRDIIRNKLKERLPGVFEKYGEKCPKFSFRDQGSYEMGTGSKPLDNDFDIDQGLYFEVSTTDYPDPVVLKKRVHEALEGHTDSVRIRRPCVTVQYHRDKEPLYHVDIAIYSDGSANADGKSRLAVGRENSTEEFRIWEVSNPQALIDTIFAKFREKDRDQFRRIVRYLKRWKDENFSSDGNAAPLGIGLTVATYNSLAPTYRDAFMGDPDDHGAMRKLVRAILACFIETWSAEEQRWVRRLKVILPVEPWNDLFEQMTNRQMERFEEKLKKLLEALDQAAEDVDPVEACKRLRKVFGPAFPVPEKQETAKQHGRAIVSSSSSA